MWALACDAVADGAHLEVGVAARDHIDATLSEDQEGGVVLEQAGDGPTLTAQLNEVCSPKLLNQAGC